MKYYIDTEFIEGFHKPLFGKKRHFIDLISIGIVCEDGRTYYAFSSEYNYNDADEWVKKNVIDPMYIDLVHGDQRNGMYTDDFHKHLGKSNNQIKQDILKFFGCYSDLSGLSVRAPEGIEVYGYYADYDWVLLCSLFGRMPDQPIGFPMYCRDLKQSVDLIASYYSKISSEGLSFSECLNNIKNRDDYPKQTNEHNALADARWNKELHALCTYLESIALD